jgi:hypothetical protein
MTTGAPTVVVGRQQRYYEMPAAIAGVVVWGAVAATEGPAVGLKYVWILALGVWLGMFCVLMRVHVRGSTFAVRGSTFIFALIWRTVDLGSLASIGWKRTGGAASRGTIFVRDRGGHLVRVPVGRLDGIDVWGPALLDAAAASHAEVEPKARHLLEGAGAPAGSRR